MYRADILRPFNNNQEGYRVGLHVMNMGPLKGGSRILWGDGAQIFRVIDKQSEHSEWSVLRRGVRARLRARKMLKLFIKDLGHFRYILYAKNHVLSFIL